jgi:uncharacterized protein with FMN-binding domain
VRKIALSLFVIAASGAYVWNQSGRAALHVLMASLHFTGGTQKDGSEMSVPASAVVEPAVTVQAEPIVVGSSLAPAQDNKPAPSDSLASTQPAAPVPPGVPPEQAPNLTQSGPFPSNAPVYPQTWASTTLPQPNAAYPEPDVVPLVTPSVSVPAVASYIDGTYIGPIKNAYYGLVQVQTTIRGGHVVGIKVLKYPSDRRTSIFINRQALPMLREEVIQAQSANVDIISGATLTSEAFIRSLDAALSKARS